MATNVEDAHQEKATLEGNNEAAGAPPGAKAPPTTGESDATTSQAVETYDPPKKPPIKAIPENAQSESPNVKKTIVATLKLEQMEAMTLEGADDEPVPSDSTKSIVITPPSAGEDAQPQKSGWRSKWFGGKSKKAKEKKAKKAKEKEGGKQGGKQGGRRHKRNRSLSQSVGNLEAIREKVEVDNGAGTPTNSRHHSLSGVSGTVNAPAILTTDIINCPHQEGEEEGSLSHSVRDRDDPEDSISRLEPAQGAVPPLPSCQLTPSQGCHSRQESQGQGHSRQGSLSQAATVTMTSPDSHESLQELDAYGGEEEFSQRLLDDAGRCTSPDFRASDEEETQQSDDEGEYGAIDDVARGMSPGPAIPLPPCHHPELRDKPFTSGRPVEDWPLPPPLQFAPVNRSAWKRPSDHPTNVRTNPRESQLSLKKLTTALRSTNSALKAKDNYTHPQTKKRYAGRKCLTKPSQQVKNSGQDNKDCELVIFEGDILRSGVSSMTRFPIDPHSGWVHCHGPPFGLGTAPVPKGYQVERMLGKGTFGQVARCRILNSTENPQRRIAIKVVKNKSAYHQQAISEIKLLQQLNSFWDKDGTHHIVRLEDFFIHCNHLCLVFPLLGMNLYELIKRNKFRGLPCDNIRVITKQLLEALVMLHRASVIHCDMKPENILVDNMEKLTIKVIDFGSACYEGETLYTYIQSRFYRSPEVLLGIGYGMPIDMWSLGCIAAELYLGLPLYPGKNECTQLHRIQNMQGALPPDMIARGKKRSKFFNRAPDGSYVLKSPEEYARSSNTKPVVMKQYYKAKTISELILNFRIKKTLSLAERKTEIEKRTAFYGFLRGVLALEPGKRWTAWQALHHPFITGRFSENFNPPPDPQPKLSSEERSRRRRTPRPSGSTMQQVIESMHQKSPGRQRARTGSGAGLTYQQQRAGLPSLYHPGPPGQYHHPQMGPLNVLNGHLNAPSRPGKSHSVPNLSIPVQYGGVMGPPDMDPRRGPPMQPGNFSHPRGPMSLSAQNSPRGPGGPVQRMGNQSQRQPGHQRHRSMPQMAVSQQMLPAAVSQQIQRQRIHHHRNRSVPSMARLQQQFRLAAGQPVGKHRRASSGDAAGRRAFGKPFAAVAAAMALSARVPLPMQEQSQQSRRRGGRGRHGRHHSNPAVLAAVDFGSPQVAPMHLHQGHVTPNSADGTPSRSATNSASLSAHQPYQRFHGMPTGPTPIVTPPSRGLPTFATPAGWPTYSAHSAWSLGMGQPYQGGFAPPVMPLGYALPPHQRNSSFPGQVMGLPPPGGKPRSQSDPTGAAQGGPEQQQQSGRGLAAQAGANMARGHAMPQPLWKQEDHNSSQPEGF